MNASIKSIVDEFPGFNLFCDENWGAVKFFTPQKSF